MSTNLEPEEVQAIMDLAAPDEGPHRSPPEVSTRNFAKPLRLSPDELLNAHKLAHRALLPVAEHFEGSLRRAHALEIVEISEVNAVSLFAGLAGPFAIARFEVAGQPGWLVWELSPALSTAEVLLGAVEPGPQEPRAFSTLERRALERLVTPLVTALGSSLGVEISNLQFVRLAEDVGSWAEGGERAEPSRLHLALSFEGPGEASTFDLYLPGVEPLGAKAGAHAPAAALPGHLGAVTVNLVARLGANQIPLADLLAIEVGDVIPLATPVDQPLHIYVEDVSRPCGRGYLGSKQGNLAIRLEQIGLEDEEN